MSTISNRNKIQKAKTLYGNIKTKNDSPELKNDKHPEFENFTGKMKEMSYKSYLIFIKISFFFKR